MRRDALRVRAMLSSRTEATRLRISLLSGRAGVSLGQRVHDSEGRGGI